METHESQGAQLPQDEKLKITALSEMFSVLNQSYKLLWFRGILAGVGKGKTIQSFEEIVQRMVVDAWYPVLGLHLRLGLMDALETLVNRLSKTRGLLADAKPSDIFKALQDDQDQEIIQLKSRLISLVPYTFQAPFMNGNNLRSLDDHDRAVDQINNDDSMIYTVDKAVKLTSRIGRVVLSVLFQRKTLANFSVYQSFLVPILFSLFFLFGRKRFILFFASSIICFILFGRSHQSALAPLRDNPLRCGAGPIQGVIHGITRVGKLEGQGHGNGEGGIGVAGALPDDSTMNAGFYTGSGKEKSPGSASFFMDEVWPGGETIAFQLTAGRTIIGRQSRPRASR